MTPRLDRRRRRRSRAKRGLLALAGVGFLPLVGCKAMQKIGPIIGLVIGLIASKVPGLSGSIARGPTFFPGSGFPTNLPVSPTQTFGPSGQMIPTNIPRVDTGSRVTIPPGTSFFTHPPMRSSYVENQGHFWDCRSDCGRPHHGNDLRGNFGDPVFAVADGVVQRARNKSSYGPYVVITHDAVSPTKGLNYRTLSAHIVIGKNPRTQKQWAVGDRIQSGEQIGVLGRDVKFAHCHFEVLVADGGQPQAAYKEKGTPLNPNAFANFHKRGATGKQFTRYQPQHGRDMV